MIVNSEQSTVNAEGKRRRSAEIGKRVEVISHIDVLVLVHVHERFTDSKKMHAQTASLACSLKHLNRSDSSLLGTVRVYPLLDPPPMLAAVAQPKQNPHLSTLTEEKV